MHIYALPYIGPDTAAHLPATYDCRAVLIKKSQQAAHSGTRSLVLAAPYATTMLPKSSVTVQMSASVS